MTNQHSIVSADRGDRDLFTSSRMRFSPSAAASVVVSARTVTE
jgi:hypothetical protein